MSMRTGSVLHTKEYRAAERKLSELVTNIEFTMVSVVAGLMLVPLIDYATPLIHELRFEFWVYILAQLAIILFFWTAMTVHALTFIAWPIDVGHNLMYLILFPVVGIANHFISDPGAFYPMLVVIALLSSLLTFYDLALIRRRRIGSQGKAAQLYQAAYSRQITVMYLSIVGLFMTIVMSGLVGFFPDFFIEKHMHLVLGFGLLAFILFAEGRELQQLSGIRDLLLSKTAEEIVTEGTMFKT